MKAPVSISILVVVTCLFYATVGRLVPQEEQPPPKSGGANLSAPELAEVGKSIFSGACTQCHGAIGSGGSDRAPGLDGVAARAEGRAKIRTEETGKPYTPDDYLAESLMDPGAYLVERSPGVKYGNIMSFNLRPSQKLAVLAFLQSLGGTPNVTASSDLWKKWGEPIEEEGEGEGGGAAAGPVPQGSPEDMIKKFGCVGCHDFEGKTIPSGGGPWLSDVGARMSPPDILTQIILPDSAIAEPPPGVTFAKGLMRPTLEGNGFYTQVGQEDLQKLVLWLSEKKGQ